MVDFMSLVEKEDPDEIYELIDEIAVGSYGSVYKALHLPSQKIVAMKIMEPDEDEELDDFAAEIAVLKDCSHPNIVNYVGAYIKGDEIFISMEFCLEAGTLVRRANGAVLPARAVVPGDVLLGDDCTPRQVLHATCKPAAQLFRLHWNAPTPSGARALTNYLDCTPGHVLVLGLLPGAVTLRSRSATQYIVTSPQGGGVLSEAVPYSRHSATFGSRSEAERAVAQAQAKAEAWVWEVTAADFLRFCQEAPVLASHVGLVRHVEYNPVASGAAASPASLDDVPAVAREIASTRKGDTVERLVNVALGWERVYRCALVDELAAQATESRVFLPSESAARLVAALVHSTDRTGNAFCTEKDVPLRRVSYWVTIGAEDASRVVPFGVSQLSQAEVSGREFAEITLDGNARFVVANNSLVTHNCDGGQCNDIFKQEEKALQEPFIQAIVRGTMQALEYMHSLRIVHRDIKAANILLNADGTVKLADFGVSALLAEKPEGAFTFIGTPYWMAPEVIDNKSASVNPYGMKSDIWSLGITAIELAQITPPLSDVHPMRALFQIPLEEPPTLKDPNSWTPDFSDYLTKSLIKDPKTRASSADLLEHPWLQLFESGVDLVRRLAARLAAFKAGKKPPRDDLALLQKIAVVGEAAALAEGATATADARAAAPVLDVTPPEEDAGDAPTKPAKAVNPSVGNLAVGEQGVPEPITLTRETGADDSGALADQVKSLVGSTPEASSKTPGASRSASRRDDDDDEDDPDSPAKEIEKKAGIEGQEDNEQHAKEVLSKTLRRSTLAREKRPQHRLTAKEEVALAEHAQVRRFQKKVSKQVDQQKKKQVEAEAALLKKQEDEVKSMSDRFASKISDVESRGKASQEAKSNQFKQDKKRMDKDYEDRQSKVAKERAKEIKEATKALASVHKKRKKESEKHIKAEIGVKEKQMKEKLKALPKAEQSDFKKKEKSALDRLQKQLMLETTHRLDAEKLEEEQALAEKHQAATHTASFEHMTTYLKEMLDTSDEVHRLQTETFETLARLKLEQRDSIASMKVTHAEQFHQNREKHQMELLSMENEQIISMMDIEHKYRSREMVAQIRNDTKEFKKKQSKLKKQGTLSKVDFKKKAAVALEAFETEVKARQEAFKKELEDDRAYQRKIVEMRNEKRAAELKAKQDAELREVREQGEEGRVALVLELENMRHALLEHQQRKTAELVREQIKRKREHQQKMAEEKTSLIEEHATAARDLADKQAKELEALADESALAALKERHATALAALNENYSARIEECKAHAEKVDKELVEQYERLASNIVKNQKEELDRADARVIGAGGTPPPRRATVLEHGLDENVPAEALGEWSWSKQ